MDLLEYLLQCSFASLILNLLHYVELKLREGIATKKRTFFSFLIMICLMISGCVDFSVGKRPIDQKDTKWVCINPDSYFEANDKYLEITGNNTYETIMLDGITTEIAVDFD